MNPDTKEGTPFTLSVSVLGIKEEKDYCAVALEMDLRGYGSTFEKALEDLHNQIRMQVTFALQMGEPEMIDRPAEEDLWEIYRAEKRRQLTVLAGRKASKSVPHHLVKDIPLTADYLKNNHSGFELACAH